MQLLHCASSLIHADARICELANLRCSLDPFVASAGAPTLFVERRSELVNSRKVESNMAPWGFYALEGDRVLAHIPDDMWAAEAVLRIAWQVATFRLRGILMHGCGLDFGGEGIAAIGHSGAGKSTLAALSSDPPGNATLLTDEIVQLMPDATLHGTPFRSNLDRKGSLGGVPLKTLVLLRKGPHEAMDAVKPTDAVPELLPQLYGSVTPEFPQAQSVRSLLALVDRVGVHALTFRKDPAVGPFLRRWVETRVGP